MSYFHSFRQVRRNLMKAVPYDKQKREFILGYLEGHAEQKGRASGWQISDRNLQNALKKLEFGGEASEPTWRQVGSHEVSKIKQSFGGSLLNRKPQKPSGEPGKK